VYQLERHVRERVFNVGGTLVSQALHIGRGPATRERPGHVQPVAGRPGLSVIEQSIRWGATKAAVGALT
jgi:hypothetical protein